MHSSTKSSTKKTTKKRGQLESHIEALLRGHHLLTAPGLLQELGALGHKYNKTSVYRALERMIEAEQVCRLSMGSMDTYYELRENHHDHLVCTTCGTTQAADVAQIPTVVGGFITHHHHLTVFGECGACHEDVKGAS